MGGRLAYVLKRFPRISETFIAAELIELERQGERPIVFAISRPEEPFAHAFLRDLKAPVVYLPHRPLREPIRAARALANALRRHPRGLARAARSALSPPRVVGLRRLVQAAVLRDEIERAGVKHVHAHFATAASRLANLAWHMGGPSYSVTAHAKDIYHWEVRPDHLRDKLGCASFVATVSPSNRSHLRRLLNGRGRLEVVPNSVDLRRLGNPRREQPEPGLVMSVARLVEKKGLATLIDACARVHADDLRLAIVGEGPLRGQLEQAAARTAAPVELLGALPNEQVLDLLRRAAVFCLPCVIAPTGDRDGLPSSVLEAMALGVPVVTTPVNGLAEAVIDERTGLLVPERDTAALAAAIERLLSDSALADRLAAEARRHVKRRFSLERSASTLQRLFAEAA